jgi:hexosaminidase
MQLASVVLSCFPCVLTLCSWYCNLQARVLGGEAAAWGELIDGSSLLNTVWPRTAAVAERLWSPRSVDNPTEAKPRLAAFRCLLLERGVPAGTLDFTKTNYALAEAGQPPPRPGSCYTQ